MPAAENRPASASERLPQAPQVLLEVRNRRKGYDLFGGQFLLSIEHERDRSELVFIQPANAFSQRGAVLTERIEGFCLAHGRELRGVSGVVRLDIGATQLHWRYLDIGKASDDPNEETLHLRNVVSYHANRPAFALGDLLPLLRRCLRNGVQNPVIDRLELRGQLLRP
jgi:hypothetical protein